MICEVADLSDILPQSRNPEIQFPRMHGELKSILWSRRGQYDPDDEIGHNKRVRHQRCCDTSSQTIRLLRVKEAAAAQNPAIIYTIPTNAPSSTPQRPNSLFPSRPTSYYAHSTDLPPSYEDVTKDSPVVVILPMAEDTAPTPTQAAAATTTPSHAPATIVPTNTSTTTASA
uniref:Putative c-mpl binding protein n=1 Tax=Aedes albopictus TaxID=7160 RepID=A0A023EHL5_AEDAL